ncbi:MAG: plasmid partition protein ParG [Terriglobia bacterium]
MAKGAKQQEAKKKRVNLNLDADIHRLFKMATAMRRTDMTHAILAFIDGYIDQHLSEEMKRELLRKRPT